MVIVVSEPFFEVFRLVSGNDADGNVFVGVGFGAAGVDLGVCAALRPYSQQYSCGSVQRSLHATHRPAWRRANRYERRALLQA